MDKADTNFIPSTWCGYDYIISQLATHGLMVPSAFQQIAVEFYENTDRRLLEQYWREVAREYVTSGGTARSDVRHFPPDARGYRSKILDALGQGGPSEEPLFSLIPELHKFVQRQFADASLSSELHARMTAQKRSELQLPNEFSVLPVNNNADKLRVFNDMFPKLGYSRFDQNSACLKKNGLLLIASIDSGGRYGMTQMLQWNFCCTAESNPSEEPFFLRWDKICPGFDYYNRFETSEEARLGILANLRMGIFFAESLDISNRTKSMV